jgi:hypothetical protein
LTNGLTLLGQLAIRPKIYVRPIPFLAGCCYPRKLLSNKIGIGL